jgi:hypothetical protein
MFFVDKHERSTLLKIGIKVVYYKAIINNEEQKPPGQFFILISTVKNDLK